MELDYDTNQTEAFKQYLADMAVADTYEHADFEVADGISVECDWTQEYDEGLLPIDVLIHGQGFQLFTRGTGDTLAETGSYGHGPNHGDTISADVGAWVANKFNREFDELIFEFSESCNGDAWLFTAWVPNPHFRE